MSSTAGRMSMGSIKIAPSTTSVRPLSLLDSADATILLYTYLYGTGGNPRLRPPNKKRELHYCRIRSFGRRSVTIISIIPGSVCNKQKLRLNDTLPCAVVASCIHRTYEYASFFSPCALYLFFQPFSVLSLGLFYVVHTRFQRVRIFSAPYTVLLQWPMRTHVVFTVL